MRMKIHLGYQLANILSKRGEKYFLLWFLRTIPGDWKAWHRSGWGLVNSNVGTLYVVPPDNAEVHTLQRRLPAAALYFAEGFNLKKHQQYRNVNSYVTVTNTEEGFGLMFSNVYGTSWLPDIPTTVDNLLEGEGIPWKRLRIPKKN